MGIKNLTGKAEQQGVDIELIGNSIQMLTHGLKVTDFMPSDSNEEVDIVIKDLKRNTEHLMNLTKYQLKEKNGLVALSSFIKRTPKTKLETYLDII